MPLFICGETALGHYRRALVHAQPVIDARNTPSLNDALFRASDIAETSLAKLGIDDPSEDDPLHIMVPSARMRPKSAIYAGHVYRSPLPSNSICYATSEVSVSSPELTFVQMATVLKLPELIALGMELCGTYRRNALDSKSGKTRTLYKQPQLTTTAKLRDYVDSAGSMAGVKQARRALQYVRDYSASPYETIVYLLLCLPRRMGGYALPEPELNPSITFSKRGRKFTLRHSARGDLYWRDAKLDLEYNGGDHEETRAADSMRRKALERMNVQVIELTSDEVNDVDLFHATALRIANTLGVRIRVERDFSERRDALRYALFHDSCSTKYESEPADNTEAESGFDDDLDYAYDADDHIEPEDMFYGFFDLGESQDENADHGEDFSFEDGSPGWDGVDDLVFDWDGWTVEMPQLSDSAHSEGQLLQSLNQVFAAGFGELPS